MRVLPIAQKEADKATIWFEDQRPGLGEEFLADLAHLVDAILQEPRRFARCELVRNREVREGALERFPYLIPYEIAGQDIILLAVAHAHRKPYYWKRRHG